MYVYISCVYFILQLSSLVHFLSLDVQVGQQQRWSSRSTVWRSQWSSLGFNQQSFYSTQEVEKEPEEEPLHTIITDTESVEGA